MSTPDVAAAALGELGMKDLDELYEKIGLGERLAPLVARRLLPGAQAEDGSGAPAPLAIAGTEGLLVTYARCCFPIPDDPIFAFLSAGRGVVIHRENCVNVEDYRKHPEKWLPVTWQTGAGSASSAPRSASTSSIAPACWRRSPPPSPAPRPTSTTSSIDEQDSEPSILTFELRGARPQAPGAHRARHPPHAGRSARHAHRWPRTRVTSRTTPTAGCGRRKPTSRQTR